ncbi:hypothetical protein QCD71_21725 [Sphingomonas sp. PsM26]|nr:hypothetical protein [Sphingomonas sp. PsM26]
MADIKDVTAVVASALTEVNLGGSLDVMMDDGEVVEAIGEAGGDAVEVVVIVCRIDDQAPTPPIADRP